MERIEKDAPGAGRSWARAVRRGEPVALVSSDGVVRVWTPTMSLLSRLRRRLLWPLAYVLHP